MQTAQIVDAPAAGTPLNEVQHVADYQEGWNAAQRGKPHKFNASIYYSMGFVDGAYVQGMTQ